MAAARDRRQYVPREIQAVFLVNDRTDEQLIAEAEERARAAGFDPIDPAPTIMTHALRDISVRIVYTLCRPKKEKGPEHPPRTPKGRVPQVTFVNTAKRHHRAGAL